MILRARLVLPITREPIEDGAVAIKGTRILAVGRWRDWRREPGQKFDLGEVLLAPGLINAHCHLDYTDMAGQLPPTRHFTDWLKSIVTIKADWIRKDYLESWKHGAEMLLRTGTTTVADIEAVPELLPEAWDSTPLRVISFFEMIGITERRPPVMLLEETLAHIARLPKAKGRVALSPHAPYSTLPALLQTASAAARKRKLLVATHVAESKVEYNMFRHRRGDMFHWLKKSTRDVSDCGLGSPVEHMARNGALGPNTLVIHANYLGPGDAQTIAESGASVIHCPRSHLYFRHARFPLQRLLQNGVNVGLGTDSLISVLRKPRQHVELSMFEEMRTLAEVQRIRPRRIVEMATVNGAHALGKAGQLGELRADAVADLIAIPFSGKRKQSYSAMVAHQGSIHGSMLNGLWAIRPSGLSRIKRTP